MKFRYALLSIASAMLSAPAFAADPVRIGTGVTNGGYHLAGQMVAESLKYQKVDSVVKTDLGGSWVNMKMLIAGDLDFIIAQKEAQARANQEQAVATRMSVEIVGNAIPELVTFICKREGYKSFSDFVKAVKGGKGILAVGGADSGAALVLRNIMRSNPDIEIRGDRLKYVKGVEAVSTGEADCAIVAAVPDAPDYETARANSKILHIVNFDVGSVIDPNTGKAFYSEIVVRPENMPGLADEGRFSNNTKSLAAFSAFYVRKQLDPTLKAKLAQAVTALQSNNDFADITPGWFRKLVK